MSERERIGSRLRDIVVKILQDEQGEAGIVYRTYDGKTVPDQSDWSIVSWPEPANPLEGIKIAATIEGHARWLWHRYIEQARGSGRTWSEIAPFVGVDEDADEKDHEAFIIASGGEEVSPYRSRYVMWKCAACDKQVKDMGPYGGHPDDCESGHAETCIRHNAEVQAYRTAWDDE